MQSEDIDVRITTVHIDRLVKEIERLLDGKRLTKMNMLRVAVSCIAVTKKMSDLPNTLKKRVIIVALNKVIEAHVEQQEDRKLLFDALVDVDQSIDLAIDIQKGRIGVQQGCCTIM
jgi:hypothetical protein